MGASQSTSSSTSNNERKYDVFISFRGEDTGNNITSHLYVALCRKKINTFIDYQLTQGDEISPARRKAIEEATISIVIFSKDYASSKRCLRELVEIIKYKEVNNQVVIPVFYHVDPSHVRKQTGSFADSFVKHEKHDSREEVMTWRKALTEASNLSGWYSSVIRSEATLVDKIVEDVLKKLNDVSPSSDYKSLIGIDARTKRVKSLLCIGMLDFRVVGIWGMGGIGKTTIAGAVFDEICNQFEGACFITVKEESEKRLREQVLSKILEENINLGSPNILHSIKRRLGSKKVLVVLDDVNSSKQLEILAKGFDQFGPGSRIIITTRDKQVLLNFGVGDNIYKVDALDNHEALQLFGRCAFKEDHLPEDLMLYSQRVVDYAKGNPLSLKVLGCLLYGRSKIEWESALRKLHRISSPEIHGILKISFDGLDDEEQNIFLDIACFFKAENIDYVMQILNGRYLSAQVGISVLVDKSLITISQSNNEIQMHDLLQEMGWEIVRQRSSTEPGKRSRLHNHEDAYLVLKRNSGTEMIEGIFLNMSKIKNLDLDSQVFQRMHNLKYLKFYDEGDINMSKVNLPHGLSYLPEELRYLHWSRYPSKTLPSNFNIENLVRLNLSNGNVERLWEGEKQAPNLRSLNVSDSCLLTEFPDLSNTPFLEYIDLSRCRSLVSISSSLQHLKNLRFLHLLSCESLRSFPNIHFESLVTLELSDCTNLMEFPQISGKIERLHLDETAIEEIPSSIGSLTGLIELHCFRCPRLKHISSSICKLKLLEKINLKDCSKLECFPEILETMEHLTYIQLFGTAIKELPSSIENLKGLWRLVLQECKNLVRLPSAICTLRCLEELEISNCPKLVNLPENLGNLRSLKRLNATQGSLCQLPSSLTDLVELQRLNCSYCKGLALPPLSSSLCSLTELCLNDCDLLKIPESIGYLPSLECLQLCANDFESLPQSMKQLSKLRVLKLNDCTMLRSLPEFPPCLQTLEATNCKELRSLPDASFVELIIQRCTNDDLHFMDTIFGFTNCLKLNPKTFNNVLGESFRRVQLMTMSSPNPEKEDMIRTPISIWYPGSEIPDWFSHRSFGSSINGQLAPPQHNSSSCKFLGFALCVVIEFERPYCSEGLSLFYNAISCRCRFGTNYGEEIVFAGSFWFSVIGEYTKKTFIDSDHVVLGFWDYSNLKQVWNDNITFSLDFRLLFHISKCRVKCCGVCPIYAESNLTQASISFEKFGTLNQEFEKTKKFPDEADTSGGENGISNDVEMNPCPETITGSKSLLFINSKVVPLCCNVRDKVGFLFLNFWIFIAFSFCGLCIFGMLWSLLVLSVS